MISPPALNTNHALLSLPCCGTIVIRPECKFVSFAVLRKSDSQFDGDSKNPEFKTKRRIRPRKPQLRDNKDENAEKEFPPMIPRKARRGRKSEAAAVEDYIRDSLSQTFASIRQQNPEIVENIEKIMKDKVANGSSNSNPLEEEDDDDGSDEDDESISGEKKMLIEEENQDWPLDADVGWGIRASDYFEQHPIKNIVGDDGSEIDWVGEIDDGLVKEINCLEWESFAFHPSPLIVLVFERYNRASDNWKVLKELEEAALIYWKSKDRLPPRTVKIDMNIERDLAYALKVKECPQILFLRGNKILHREKEFRSADELIQMIAHFYYNAKKPSCINDVFT